MAIEDEDRMDRHQLRLAWKGTLYGTGIRQQRLLVARLRRIEAICSGTKRLADRIGLIRCLAKPPEEEE